MKSLIAIININDLKNTIFFLLLIFSLACCSNGGKKADEDNINNSNQAKKSNIILPQKKTINQNFVLPHGDYKSEVIKKYSHLRTSFTEGFEYIDGFLYESTGMVGSSELMKCELETGKIVQNRRIPGLHFGEGMTVFGNRIYQITWQSGICFVWDKRTFELINTFNYNGEGWGITNDGEQLIMSNGTNLIRFVNPKNFNTERTIEVLDENYPVKYINELEYVNGEIWANVWQKDKIYRIDPESGNLLGKIDIFNLYKYIKPSDSPDVLNGIAYDSENNRIFVTGKYWPFVFEIKPVK